MKIPYHSSLSQIMGFLASGVLISMLLFSLPAVARSWGFLHALLVTPYPNDGLEGTLLHEARLLWAGEALYRPLTRYEFVSAPYPPLYTASMALFNQLQGPSVFWGGRLVSTLSAFGLCLAIILIVRVVGGSWLAGLIGASMFFMAPAVTLWATRIKPDMLAICLATWGLLAVIRGQGAGDQQPSRQQTADRRPGGQGAGGRGRGAGDLEPGQELGDQQPSRPQTADTRPGEGRTVVEQYGGLLAEKRQTGWLIVGAILFTLAFFTRQTTGMAAVASGLGLLLNDILDYRRGSRASFIRAGMHCLPLRQSSLMFGFVLGVLCLGGWWLADVITAGQYSAHVWGLHRSEWWSLYLVQKYTRQLYPYWSIVLLLIPLLIQTRHDPRARILSCYVLLAPITLIGAAEISAHHNHLLETILACSLVLGIALAWAARQGRGLGSGGRGRKHDWISIWSALPVLVLASGQIWLASQPHPFFKGELEPPDPPLRFVAFVANTPGEILADDVGLLLAGGKPVRYNDPSTMGPAARWGIWDQSGLLEEIAAKKFSAIMLRDDVEKDPYDDVGRWTREMRQAINTYYQIKFRDKIRVYVPKE